MATIVDVARAAGVSRGTASNVFNHPELVREALRDRVIAAATALGYAGPNPLVRFLKGGKLRAIGVTPPGAYGVQAAFANSYLREFLSGVAQVCDARGASLTIVSGVGEDNTWGIRNAAVDGFIMHRFEEAAIIEAQRRQLPCVFVDMDGGKQSCSVRINDRDGARAAAEHLLELGHRKFAIFSVLRAAAPGTDLIFHERGRSRHRLSSDFAVDRDRLRGYTDALRTAGLKPTDIPIVETWADVISASRKGAACLFDRAPDVTAVLAMTDVQALAVVAEAQHRGIRVPEELSVVGFDDIAESANSNPPLTTVSHPMAEKGRRAAELVFEGVADKHVVLPVRLTIRGSTAEPPRPARTAAKLPRAPVSRRRA